MLLVEVLTINLEQLFSKSLLLNNTSSQVNYIAQILFKVYDPEICFGNNGKKFNYFQLYRKLNRFQSFISIDLQDNFDKSKKEESNI